MSGASKCDGGSPRLTPASSFAASTRYFNSGRLLAGARAGTGSDEEPARPPGANGDGPRVRAWPVPVGARQIALGGAGPAGDSTGGRPRPGTGADTAAEGANDACAASRAGR